MFFLKYYTLNRTNKILFTEKVFNYRMLTKTFKEKKISNNKRKVMKNQKHLNVMFA